MGILSEKVKAATRLVVAQLPTVTVLGIKCHVQCFGGQMELFKARGRATELLCMDGNREGSNLVVALVTVQIALALCLVDEDGKKIVSDNEDLQAVIDDIEKTPGLQTRLSELSGFDEYLVSITPKTATSGPQLTVEEAVLGNSEPSLPSE